MSDGARPRLNLAVQYAVSATGKPSRAQFRKWAQATLEHDARITIRVTGQAEGLALNRNFRAKNYSTNVLTFIFRDKAPFEGDLALCAPVVAREARAQKKIAGCTLRAFNGARRVASSRLRSRKRA